MSTTLTEAIGAAPVVLDGGLATQLESQGRDLDSALWSAQLLHDDPDAVVQAHRAYFAAGAQVAT
ncbi:MAG TPA: homocysteine S-methyltransferase family protein, partial [Propionibacteriaceae bacterium]|nr:homocysteine S-methyltransferase family protein [Propionibacteriaceae bacterium]